MSSPPPATRSRPPEQHTRQSISPSPEPAVLHLSLEIPTFKPAKSRSARRSRLEAAAGARCGGGRAGSGGRGHAGGGAAAAGGRQLMDAAEIFLQSVGDSETCSGGGVWVRNGRTELECRAPEEERSARAYTAMRYLLAVAQEGTVSTPAILSKARRVAFGPQRQARRRPFHFDTTRLPFSRDGPLALNLLLDASLMRDTDAAALRTRTVLVYRAFLIFDSTGEIPAARACFAAMWWSYLCYGFQESTEMAERGAASAAAEVAHTVAESVRAVIASRSGDAASAATAATASATAATAATAASATASASHVFQNAVSFNTSDRTFDEWAQLLETCARIYSSIETTAAPGPSFDAVPNTLRSAVAIGMI